jgi:hypothetical protein
MFENLRRRGVRETLSHLPPHEIEASSLPHPPQIPAKNRSPKSFRQVTDFSSQKQKKP